MSIPDKVAPRSQASSSVWNPLLKAGFVPPEGREAILLHPDSGTTVYFLPPSAGMKVTSNWQVGETSGKGWPYLARTLADLGVAIPDQKSGPPKKMGEAEFLEQGRHNSAAVRGTARADNLFDGSQRPSVAFTVTFKLPDGSQVEHKSMAPHWARAVGLAISALAREGKLSPDVAPQFSVEQR